MFVTNHVLSGVIIGKVFERRPVAAFLAGVGSHLVLDAMPHWGCDFDVDGGPQRFFQVARRDGLLGLGTMATAAVAIDRSARVSTVAAMAGAALLDLDKPAHMLLGIQPFPKVITRIHRRVQNESTDGLSKEIVYGLLFALVDAVIVSRSRQERPGRLLGERTTEPAVGR
jgi:hypothetical protein